MGLGSRRRVSNVLEGVSIDVRVMGQGEELCKYFVAREWPVTKGYSKMTIQNVMTKCASLTGRGTGGLAGHIR